jgi:hypothetical protein
MNKIPILLLAFNRLDTLKEVFSEIISYAPDFLMISIDGPRPGVPGEEAMVKEVETYLKNRITWQCDVVWLVSENNKGCGRAVSDAIDCFFERVDFGIILEDDCKPRQEFFLFCEQNRMIRHSISDIGCISGTRFKAIGKRFKVNHLSYFPMIWGWATWSDVWEQHRKRRDRENDGASIKPSFVKKNYLKVKQGLVDTWDYQWIFSFYSYNKKSLVPSCSLVENIGFDSDKSTHTRSDKSRLIDYSENCAFSSVEIVHRIDPYYEWSLKHIIFRDNFFWKTVRFLKKKKC